MEKRCPKCNIKVEKIATLLAEKRRREYNGTFVEIEENQDCDLCSAKSDKISIQKQMDFLDLIK